MKSAFYSAHTDLLSPVFSKADGFAASAIFLRLYEWTYWIALPLKFSFKYFNGKSRRVILELWCSEIFRKKTQRGTHNRVFLEIYQHAIKSFS